jgi:hypothetical protein
VPVTGLAAILMLSPQLTWPPAAPEVLDLL